MRRNEPGDRWLPTAESYSIGADYLGAIASKPKAQQILIPEYFATIEWCIFSVLSGLSASDWILMQVGIFYIQTEHVN